MIHQDVVAMADRSTDGNDDADHNEALTFHSEITHKTARTVHFFPV